MPTFPPIHKTLDDPRLKNELIQMEKEMANAAESIEKQYAAIRPQLERLFRPLTKELKDAGLL